MKSEKNFLEKNASLSNSELCGACSELSEKGNCRIYLT